MLLQINNNPCVLVTDAEIPPSRSLNICCFLSLKKYCHNRDTFFYCPILYLGSSDAMDYSSNTWC